MPEKFWEGGERGGDGEGGGGEDGGEQEEVG